MELKPTTNKEFLVLKLVDIINEASKEQPFETPINYIEILDALNTASSIIFNDLAKRTEDEKQSDKQES